MVNEAAEIIADAEETAQEVTEETELVLIESPEMELDDDYAEETTEDTESTEE
jgi:hypothetical protein